MTNPPDRLSVEIESPYFDRATLDKGVDIFFNGVRQVGTCAEYCVSEGWIRRIKKTALGVTKKDEFHQPIITRLNGMVEVKWR